MPQVSVIIPVYNAQKYLKECLDSVVSQTMQDTEIICIDDGSTDNSWQILEKYRQHDNRMMLLRQENQGAGVARNKGLKISKGEYLSFLDSDDVFDVRMLECLYNHAKKGDLDIVACRAERFNTDSKIKTRIPQSIREDLLPEKKIFRGQDIKKDFFRSFIWWPWDKLYKKSYIGTLNLEFQSLRTTNDLYFVSTAVLMAERIGYINDILAYHRNNIKSSLSATRENSWDCFYNALLAVRKFLKDHNLYEHYKQDFVNYCLHFSMWNLETMTGKSYCLLYNALRNEWFKELEVIGHDAEYFYDRGLYKMLCYILETDLEDDLKHTLSADGKTGLKRLRSRLGNVYMRVKLYYEGYGLTNTLRKIFEKMQEKI